MFIARLHGYRIDVFFPSVRFYDEALSRRVGIAGRPAWTLSAEVLAVFKMLFFRPKDLVDVRRMIDIQGEVFGQSFVRKWLVDMVGEGDERTKRWDQLVGEVSQCQE